MATAWSTYITSHCPHHECGEVPGLAGDAGPGQGDLDPREKPPTVIPAWGPSHMDTEDLRPRTAMGLLSSVSPRGLGWARPCSPLSPHVRPPPSSWHWSLLQGPPSFPPTVVPQGAQGVLIHRGHWVSAWGEGSHCGSEATKDDLGLEAWACPPACSSLQLITMGTSLSGTFPQARLSTRPAQAC